MDEDTFASHSAFVVKAGTASLMGKLELVAPEQVLFNQLVESGTLLEQERIPNSYSTPRLKQAIAG